MAFRSSSSGVRVPSSNPATLGCVQPRCRATWAWDISCSRRHHFRRHADVPRPAAFRCARRRSSQSPLGLTTRRHLANVGAMCKNIHVQSLGDLLSSIEKHFGPPSEVHGATRATYSREEREWICERIIPEWLLRGRKLLPPGSPDQRRCEAAITALRGLHSAVWAKVQFRPLE